MTQHDTMIIDQSGLDPNRIIHQVPRSAESICIEKRRAASRAARMRSEWRPALRVYELAGLLIKLSQSSCSNSGRCPICARPLRGRTSIKYGIGRGCRERILSMVEALRGPERIVHVGPDYPQGLQ